MISELGDYYERVGIAATSFRCPNASSCSKGAKDFVTAREAFVGSEYERGTLPRLLFLSLDAGDTTPGRLPEERTMQYVRWAEEGGGPITTPCRPAHLPQFRHWWATHYLAHDVLAPLAAAHGIVPLTLQDVHRFFAHTNSAKCKDAARGKRQGPARVFRNCRAFIPAEVALLRPDIIITQGKWGNDALRGAFPVLQRETHPQHADFEAQVIDIGGRSVTRFSTSHQRGAGPYKREREKLYPWIVQVVQQRLSGWSPSP